MGITCSGPTAKFPFAALSGGNCGFSEVSTVCLSAKGFIPSEVCLHEGESILFEWGEEISTHLFNVIQVTGPDLIPVPGGYNSGKPTKSGQFEVCLGRKGLFMFRSESLPDKLKTLNVYVLEKPSVEVKVTRKGFETQLVNIQEGEAVHWKNENEDSNNQCLVQEMEYCFKHGGFLPKTPRIQVQQTFQSTFPNSGLYFFYLENHGPGSEEGHVANLICVVKVTQRNSDYSVRIVEDGLQPELISAAVQDRIWLDCSLSKNPSKAILDAYIYKNGAKTTRLVSARLNGTANSRLVDLVSYQFSEPGLYHYLYVMTDLSEKRGHVLVRHKPTEHLVEIVNRRFHPGLCTVKQGDRVWWTFRDEESITWYLKEVERCIPVKGSSPRRKSSNSGCCRKADDQTFLIGCLGVLSHRFDEIGVFTYCLQEDRGESSPQDTCTVLVQKNAKHHTIRVRDRGFTPRILNVHPDDWVWWQWQDTKRQHNIMQVSHQRKVMPGGIQSGEPTHVSNAFSSVFKELGIFYFASNGLPEVFGAIVVTPEPQVHRVEVTDQGIHPDPLLITVNDCVAWVWSDGEGYEVQEYSDAVNKCGSASRSRNYVKSCHARVIRKPGVYHLLFTPKQMADNELGTRPFDSLVHTIVADPITYSCMVEVAADGFRPSTLTIEKSQSVLWTWENQGSQEHNILHVRPPQDDESLVRVRGLSAFDSGPVTTSSTFFHTFDVPGTYFVTSEGTERELCVIDVKENAAFVSPPKISSNTSIHGGKVQRGHRVFLECDTQRAEMFYTLNGSYPAECNRNVMPYDKKKGVVLDQTGFVVVRAVAKKDNWVTSQVYTSKRFWVIHGDSIPSDEVSAEEEQFIAESEEVDLKERIFHFHWLNCRPSISLQLVCDNTFHLDIALASSADVSWIRGFQLYLNGTAYGGWLSAACRGLVISGLIGGKHYHVVLVVFPTHDSYQPQLSNEVVISCPLRSSSGGPLVSLEASTTPQSLIIVWPNISGPTNVACDEVTTYSVFINGHPFGEQIIAEPESRYCRVLFESSLENEVYTLCVASCLSGSDLLLYSNEVEFSLPIPDDILSALETSEGQSDSLGRDGLDSDTPQRELLLVAERINSSSDNTSLSNIEKLCLKSSFGKLQTIFERDDLRDCDFNDKSHEGKHGDTEVNTNKGRVDVTSIDDERREVVTDKRLKESKVTTNGMSSNASVKQGLVDAEEEHQKSHSEFLGQVESSSALKDPFPVDNHASIDSPLDETYRPASGDFQEENMAIDELVSKSDVSTFKNHVDVVREEAVIAKGQPSSDEDYDEDKLETDVKSKEVPSSFSIESNDNCRLDQNNDMHVSRSDDSQQMSHKGQESLPNDEADGSNMSAVNTTNDDPQKNTFEKGMQYDSENWNCNEKETVYMLNELEGTVTSKYSELAAGISSFPAEETEAKVEQTSEKATYSDDSDESASGQKTNEIKEEDNNTSQKEQTVLHSTDVPLENPSELVGSYIQEARTFELNKVDDRAGDEESTMENPNKIFENSKRLENYPLPKEIEGQVSQDAASQKMEGNMDEFGNRDFSHLEGREESDSVNTMVKSETSLNKSCKGNIDGVRENTELINDELTDKTWSKSSSCVASEDEENNLAATAVMPTFEETDQLVDARSLPLGILGNDKVEGVKSDTDEKTEKSSSCKEEELNMQEIVTSSAGDSLQASQRPLPRPLLVVKGTTPTTVTLEWEWTLLPEQIAGSDIVYTVLVLGRKFQSNINSNFCFDFKESPASCMWDDQNDVLLQHAWRTTNTVIEITGMKQRCNYRMAVLGQLMPLAHEALSQVTLFTMPGPPKSPVIHVTDLKDREFTLSWKPAVSFGDATIVGYRLLRDGTASSDDLGSERRSVTINDLEEGKEHRFNLVAVTCHSVGDSKSSNTVRVLYPTPPVSPQICHKIYCAVGSICIVWKRDEFTKADDSEDQTIRSDIVFVDDLPHGECSLTGELDILTGELSYIIPNLEIGRKYEIHVKSYLNPRVIDVENGKRVYVCGCYGKSSNMLELFCAGPPSSPIVRVSRIDQSGVTLSWNRSSEFGGVTLGGYILQVNNKWSGEILPAEQCLSKLTGFKPGEVICVRLSAVTYDLPGPLKQMDDPENVGSRYFSHSYEQPDSGVESSSSFLSKWSADETKHYVCSADSTLVIQYSNLVRPVSSIEVVNVGSRSASITWLLDETTDRSVAPDALQIFCWKTMEDEESALKYIVTEKPFTISGLESKTEYRVFLECSAPHINDDSYTEHPINVVRSQRISFITASAPGPVSNIYVVSATEESIRLAWDNPAMHDDSIAAIRVNVRRSDHEMRDGLTMQLSSDTRSFTFDSLSPKAEYAFVFEALQKDDLIVTHGALTDSVARFSAFTNGTDPPEKVKLVSRTPTSIVITWVHAVAYGMLIVQGYRVHCVINKQLRKRSRGRFGPSKDTGKVLDVDSETCRAEIQGLDPGVVYKIVVEAVAGNTDYLYDDDFESDGSGTGSVASSVLSEKPPEMQRYFSQPFLVCTSAPLEPPVLLVSGFNANQIHLSWCKPLVLVPVSDPHCAAEEDPARGRVRLLRGYRLEVNGRVYARVAADKTSVTLRKCKSGMKYTCVLVAISGPEKMQGCQGKNARTLVTAINDTDTDEEMVAKPLSECFEESASDPVEVMLPRQDLGISISAKYSANKLTELFRDSTNSDSEDEEGGVVVQWTVNELSGDVRGFRLFWFNSKHQEKIEVLLPLDATSYEIWSALQSAVYTISLEIIDDREETLAVFGPLHCQTPGPPAPPWIWCRSLSPYQFTIEWNAPVTYGDVSIRAYQVYLNDRRLEKLVDRRQRRVTIHCQSSSLYRVSLVALGSDPQYGDSSPSNVLKLCTPVAEDRQAMTSRPSGPLTRITLDIHVSSIANTRIAFEWSHPPDVFETVDHYIVKWSSVLKPQVEELTLPLIQTSHVIDGCSPGTSHFLVVAAVTAGGDLVSRSKQLTVQTSAPIKQPCLQVKSCLQSGITIQWQKPVTFGDAEIDHFKLMLNRSLHRNLDADCTCFFFPECEPCKEYRFYLKAVSSKPDCDSEWSEPLIVTCPGALRPLITRIRSNEINCIRVGWKEPVLRGDVQVDSYRVYYARDFNAHKVRVDDVITNPQTVEHGPLPWYTTEDKLVPIPPDTNYWVVLQVDLMPGNCHPVYSEPIKTRAAVEPDPPVISLEIEGLETRRSLEQRICQLSIKRDKLHRMIYLLESSVVVKGSKMKDLQIVKATDTVLEVDSELADLLENMKEYTGVVSCVVKWCRPCDDGDAIVSGYQLFVDDKRLGEALSPSTLESRLKLPVSCHKITVQTLTDHPIGPSPCSNVVELPGSEFVPFVLFCYFDVHERGESWPRKGCCSWNDSHTYEIKHRRTTPPRVFVPLGILSRRIPCPVFEVIDPFSCVWRSLAPSGFNKMSALLFWTNWCISSQKVLGYFCQFAEEFSEKFAFITCCVRSNEPDGSHRQSLAETLIERNWRKTSNCVTHNCACNLRSQRTRSVRRRVVSEPDVCQLFGLVGVPTLIMLDSSGYISWHGRCSCFDFASFRSLLLHAFSQVSRSNCPVSDCLSCKCETDDEYVPCFPEYVDHIDEPSSGIRRKVSIESNTLYRRLHGSTQLDVLSQTETIKKQNYRPKTSTAVGRLARSTGQNRPSESNEPTKMHPRSLTTHGVHPSRPLMARPGSVPPLRVRALQRTSQPSLDEVSFPASTRQREKEARLSGKIRTPRIKAKISVEDLPLW